MEVKLITNDKDGKKTELSQKANDKSNPKSIRKNDANATKEMKKIASRLKKLDVKKEKIEDDRTVEITQIEDDLTGQLHLPKKQAETVADFIEGHKKIF